VPYVRPSVRGPKETGRSPIEALSFPFGKRIAPTHPAHFTPVNIIPPDTNPAGENPFYPRGMNVFLPQVIKAAPTANDARDRRWIYLPYDRLTDRAGPLQNTGPNQCGMVMVESLEKGSRRPYHKKKLALLLANERHFAREQAARGVKVIYIFTPGTFGDGLLDVQKKYALKQITSTRPAERELRLDLNQARRQGLQLEEVEDETWLTTEAQFDTIYPSPQTFLMDRFYRAMRKHTGLLMEPGKPIGGKFSYDYENRKPFRGEVRVPNRPSYPPDEITTEVLCLAALLVVPGKEQRPTQRQSAPGDAQGHDAQEAARGAQGVARAGQSSD
jgi:hypothetical protein